ncbi:MAG: hypothetical protein ACYDHH_30380 [Solirubrobacteraceae bacterium]
MLLLQQRETLLVELDRELAFLARANVAGDGAKLVYTKFISIAEETGFRPTISIDGTDTRVLVERTSVVDPQRLGRSAGRLGVAELRAVDYALALIFGI